MPGSFRGDTRPISFRVTELELLRLQREALSARLTLNAYLRHRVGLPPSTGVAAPRLRTPRLGRQ